MFKKKTEKIQVIYIKCKQLHILGVELKMRVFTI